MFKNLTGSDNRKRDLSIKEIVTRDGVMATVERRCVYFIRDAIRLESPADVGKLRKLRDESGVDENSPHYHIFRKYDAESQEDILICKACGKFYVVSDNSVFSISFVHSFKIRLEVDLSIKQ